jgi:hypothetical protein
MSFADFHIRCGLVTLLALVALPFMFILLTFGLSMLSPARLLDVSFLLAMGADRPLVILLGIGLSLRRVLLTTRRSRGGI